MKIKCPECQKQISVDVPAEIAARPGGPVDDDKKITPRVLVFTLLTGLGIGTAGSFILFSWFKS